MRIKQLIRGRIVGEGRGKVSTEEICDIVGSIFWEDLRQSFDEDNAKKLMVVPEVFGPTIDGNFCVLGYFSEKCEETLLRLRAAFQDKYPDQVEVISSALIGGDVNGKSRIDCGL